MTDEAIAEARSEDILKSNLKKCKNIFRSAINRLRTDEEVFLAQLYRRALLLNEGFQAKVLQIIRQHEAPIRRTESGRFESLEASIPRTESLGSNVSGNFVFVHAQAKSQLQFGRIPSNTSVLTSASDVKSSGLGSITAITSSDPDTSTFADYSSPVYCDFAEEVGVVEVYPAPIKR